MIDKSKRNTLKSVAVAGAAVTTASLSSVAFAEMLVSASPSEDISLLVGKGTHSGTMNVIIQNRGDVQKTITRMSPSFITTELGDVDLEKLFDEGPMLCGCKARAGFLCSTS